MIKYQVQHPTKIDCHLLSASSSYFISHLLVQIVSICNLLSALMKSSVVNIVAAASLRAFQLIWSVNLRLNLQLIKFPQSASWRMWKQKSTLIRLPQLRINQQLQSQIPLYLHSNWLHSKGLCSDFLISEGLHSRRSPHDPLLPDEPPPVPLPGDRPPPDIPTVHIPPYSLDYCLQVHWMFHLCTSPKFPHVWPSCASPSLVAMGVPEYLQLWRKHNLWHRQTSWILSHKSISELSILFK